MAVLSKWVKLVQGLAMSGNWPASTRATDPGYLNGSRPCMVL